jgi:hypothetical protein
VRDYPKTHFRGRKARRVRPIAQPKQAKSGLITYFIGAVVVGAAVGIGTVAISPGGLATIAATARPVTVPLGLARTRPPQPGDYWPGCNAARAAGSAPIYQGEPGYREGMDGDGDGIACEPIPQEILP